MCASVDVSWLVLHVSTDQDCLGLWEGGKRDGPAVGRRGIGYVKANASFEWTRFLEGEVDTT